MDDISKQRLNVETPARCTQHQCVKGQAVNPANNKIRCIFCKNYTLSLSSMTCSNCLSTEELCNFVVDKLVKEQEWYKNFDERL